MIETIFDATLERDEEIEVVVTATGTVEPRDESVGIMSEGVDEIEIVATDEGGNVINLTASERERLERTAAEKLSAKLLETDYGDE